MRQIEKELEKIPTRIIEHFTISSILGNLGYTRINDKVTNLIKHNILIPIKRGLYIYMPLNDKNLLTTEIVANTLLRPSYVSLDYVLSYYNAIPERVYEITSITTKRSKNLKRPMESLVLNKSKKSFLI